MVSRVMSIAQDQASRVASIASSEPAVLEAIAIRIFALARHVHFKAAFSIFRRRPKPSLSRPPAPWSLRSGFGCSREEDHCAHGRGDIAGFASLSQQKCLIVCLVIKKGHSQCE